MYLGWRKWRWWHTVYVDFSWTGNLSYNNYIICEGSCLFGQLLIFLKFEKIFEIGTKRVFICIFKGGRHLYARAPWKQNNIYSGTSLCWGAAIRLSLTETRALICRWHLHNAKIQQSNNGTSVIRGPATMKAGRWNFYGPVRCRRRLDDLNNILY